MNMLKGIVCYQVAEEEERRRGSVIILNNHKIIGNRIHKLNDVVLPHLARVDQRATPAWIGFSASDSRHWCVIHHHEDKAI